jgi:hypothetical protein
MTTFTSNDNATFGKVSGNSETFQTKYEFSQRSGCGGYALLLVLLVVLAGIVYFISLHM